MVSLGITSSHAVRAFVATSVVAAAGSASADTVAAENLSQQNALTFNWSGDTWLGQTFTSLESGRVTTVEFALTRTSQTAGVVTAELWDVSSLTDYPNPGNAGPTKLGEADAIYSGLEFGVPTFVSASFSGTFATVQAGGEYAVVFRTGPAVSLWVARGNPYAGGRFYQYTTSFGIADSEDLDAYFRVSVPTPGSAATLALAGLLTARRRR